MDMWLRKNELYHFLNGDTDCRYIPLLNGFRGHKVIATYHQPPDELCKGVSGPVLQRLTAALAVASNQVDYLTRFVGSNRVFVIPHGVDTDYFQPGEGSKIDSKLVLSVGTHLRDFDTLALAAATVERKESDIHFAVVTHPERGHVFVGLPHVRVYSHISDDDLLRLYQQADLAVFPLQDCTANNAVLEAMACGLPIVVTDVGGIRDYVDETCAMLTPRKDAQAIAEAIMQLCSDSALRQQLGKQSREKALQFDFRKVVERLAEVYEIIVTI